MTVTRRNFAKSVALAAAAPLVAMGTASAEGETPGVPQGPQAQQTPVTPEAKALSEWIRAHYGDRLTANQFFSVIDDLGGVVQRGAELSKVKLTNGEEPDFAFHPYRAPP